MQKVELIFLWKSWHPKFVAMSLFYRPISEKVSACRILKPINFCRNLFFQISTKPKISFFQPKMWAKYEVQWCQNNSLSMFRKKIYAIWSKFDHILQFSRQFSNFVLKNLLMMVSNFHNSEKFPRALLACSRVFSCLYLGR